MSLYRGAGGASDATDDSTVNAVAGYASAAASSASSAATSATSASNSASAAASSASGAASSASSVATNATNAASSASLASTYAAAASASKDAAAASAATASTKAGEATSSASSAAADASTATTKAAEAAASALAADGSADDAAASAADALAIYGSTAAVNAAVASAASSAVTASTQAGYSSDSASESAASAVLAFENSQNAGEWATVAQGAANSSQASSSSASTYASNASISASAAATSASNALTSANNAAASASTASTIVGSGNGIFGTTPISTSGTVTLSGGTANGVPYLNASKVLTSGSALTFDETNLTLANSSGVTSSLTTNQAAGTIGSPLNLDFNFKGYANYTLARIRSWDESGSTGYGYLTFWTSDGSTLAERYRITQNGTAIWNVAGTEQMRLTSTGLGIGTSSPGAKLDVKGGTTISTLAGWNTLSNSMFELANPAVRFGIGYDSSDQVLLQGFDSTNAARNIGMQVYGGNLGIGTSSPGAKLHVVGNTYVQSGTIFTDAVTAYGGTSLVLNGGSSLIALTSGTERARIDSSGNFIHQVNGTAPTLATNSTMSFELTSNTSLKIVVRGTDGVTRSVSLTLA